MLLQPLHVNIITDISEHYLENGDLSEDEITAVKKLITLCKQTSLTTGLELRLYSIIEYTEDKIATLLINEIMRLVSIDADDAELMNAFYDYLHVKYNFEVELHQSYLLMATTVEALDYCVKTVINVANTDEWAR